MKNIYIYISNEKNHNKMSIYTTLSKPHGIFTEDFASFFTLQKLKTYRNPNLKNFRRPSLGDEVQVTFIS